LAWLHEIKNQELGWRAVLRTRLHGGRVVASSSEVLPLGKCDSAAIGEPMAFYQEWLQHSTPGDPWWDAVDFGRRLEHVPPASFIGGWYDLFLKAQVDDYEALRRAGRPARLTIGPWTHGSPGLFAETVRDGPRWFDSQLGPQRAEREERQDAPVRVFVMGSRTWQEFSLWPPAGRPSGGISAGEAPWPSPRRPTTSLRTATTTTRTTRHRRWAARPSTPPRPDARSSPAGNAGATCSRTPALRSPTTSPSSAR